MSIIKIISKIAVVLLSALGVIVIATTIYVNLFTDNCVTYEGASFTSPDSKLNAYGALTTCEDRPSEMKIWIKEIGGDGSSSLVFDAIYTTSIKMDLKWKSSNELLILYPKVVTPKTNFGTKYGIRLYYEAF